jgi:hypothetical protein
MLAETDTELQRLAILRKNHADEQYLARRNHRNPPEKIERYERRIEALTADMAMMAQHDVSLLCMEISGNRMDRMPWQLSEKQTFKLGTYGGLKFGAIL